MGTLTSIPSSAWACQPLSRVWKVREHTAAYFAPPRMALVRASTQFGRLEHCHGPLALLMTVTFQNDRAQLILLRSLTIKYAGTWYHPIHFLGDRVHLWYHHGRHHLPLPRTQSLIAAPYIPAAAAAERYALFRLPESWDRWPTQLRVTAKAAFVHRRSRSLAVTLTNPA
jgi:hypothetical protein